LTSVYKSFSIKPRWETSWFENGLKTTGDFTELTHAAIERLLDPSNESVTLQTLERAAIALGKRLQIELVDFTLTFNGKGKREKPSRDKQKRWPDRAKSKA
jgi:hypothetical protein